MYSSDWAEKVYDHFYENHVLSCREVGRLYGVSVDDVLGLIVEGSKRWRRYKSLVKHVEKAISSYWKHFHTWPKVREKYLTFDKYLHIMLSKRMYPGPADLLDTEITEDLS